MKKLKAPAGAHYNGHSGEVEVPDYDVGALLARGWTLIAGPLDAAGTTTTPEVEYLFGDEDEEHDE